MSRRWRPTLRQVFALSLLGLLLALGLLFYLGVRGSEKALLKSSDSYRELASRFITSRVTDYLRQAPMAVDHFEDDAHFGLIDFKKPASVQQGLLSLLLANDNLSEATLTYADSEGIAPDGQLRIAPGSAGQVAIIRSSKPGEFIRRLTWFEKGHFVAESDLLSAGSPATPMPASTVPDPTQHLTFQTTTNREFYGQLISTDLHWAQLDESLPEAQRRVEVSVQKTIEDAHGHFAGVLRVGLLAAKINEAVQQHITGPGQPDEHLIFLCDSDGGLITGFGDHNRVTTIGEDLRIPLKGIPPTVLLALQNPVLQGVNDDHPRATTTIRHYGKLYLVSYQNLPRTQGWIVGIVVPRDFYLGDILHIRDMIFWIALALMAIIVVAGSLIVRSVTRAQWLVRLETARMKDFQFDATVHESSLSDVEEVLSGLERAKTAMRAMSKYVPVNLVRQLYCNDQDPVLGGELAELSVLFTDIRDFTVISERMTPDKLAEVLGRYLEVMAGVLQEDEATIDKFIGDAVMAFWNAPLPVADHEIHACRAALRSRDELAKLYTSPAWADAPRFETRYGLHRCQASVGHFGAPDRFNYTALGDGINLAARLEGLNKYYGTTIIVSETIHAAAKDQFQFRLLDRVAVKGKTTGIAIYELLSGKSIPRSSLIATYEEAFAAFQRADFAAAIAILEKQSAQDAPSAALLQRCRDLLANPPKDWDGIRVFDTK